MESRICGARAQCIEAILIRQGVLKKESIETPIDYLWGICYETWTHTLWRLGKTVISRLQVKTPEKLMM